CRRPMLSASRTKLLQGARLTLRFVSTMTNSHPIVSKLENHPRDKIAVRHLASGNEYSYGDLLTHICKWQRVLRSKINEDEGARIAIMGENSSNLHPNSLPVSLLKTQSP
ncbi:hypothetical protein AAULH_14296, partial [Lactobacillus helveticus MTCC 5463]